VAAAQDDADRRRRFEELVAGTYEPLQRYLRRRTDPATADDVLGDVLLVLWRRLDDVPVELPLAWAYGVARDCLANSRRSAARQERVVLRLAHASRPGETGEDDVLAEALEALPDADRELLRLWAWEQLTPAELAQVLGISPNAASIRLHRAKGRRKKLLLARKDGGAAGHPEVREEGGAGL
jgi:RNA polymerase sigma-70 factor, ECF subfamily